jgi:DNA-binding response OmpR family regulator
MSKGRVLVIEDDSEIRSLVGSILRGAGYRVEQEADGAAGFEALEAHDCDLILLDMVMPRMSGWAFLRRLSGQRSVPPVVVLSARYSRPEPLGELQSLIWGYVKKPFKAIALLETCESVLRASSGEGASRGNRRAAPRLPTHVQVTVFSESGIPVAKGRAMDISVTGARMQTDAVMASGRRVGLRFDLGDAGRPFLVNGRVMWTAKETAGVAFVELTDDQAERITGLLESAVE